MADHVRWTGGSAETTTDAGVFLHVGNGNTCRRYRPEDGYLPLTNQHLDSTCRTGLLAGTASAAALFIDLRKYPVFFVIEDHLTQGAKEFSSLPSLVSRVPDESDMVFFSPPLCR